MANIKKNNKPVKKSEPIIEEVFSEEPIEEKIVQEEEKSEPIVPQKRVFEQSDGVACRSVVSGKLYVEGIKTGMIYPFMDYGDITEIEYRDLIAAVRSKDKAVYEPRFIVEDKDFIAEYPALDEFYSSRFKTRDIKKILNMPIDEMREAISTLPNGAKESLKSLAVQQVADGTLDSNKKIKVLDEIFDTNLSLVGELITEE